MAICAACNPGEPRIGQAYLADADGTIDAIEGPVIEVGVTAIPESMTGPVRIAVDRNLPYSNGIDAIAKVAKAGGEPIVLIGRRHYVEALPKPDAKIANAIRLSARTEGKACVSPPGTEEATCVSRKDHAHIDRAFVRQIIAQAVKEYRLHHVHVVVEAGVTWGDAIRALDGARTCCGQDSGVTVSIDPGW